MSRAVVGRDVGRHSVTTVERRRSVESMIIDVISLIFGIIIVLLGLRFILLLLGANPDSGFTQFVYGVTAPLMAPFEAVFGATQAGETVFDWSTLLAIAIYALIAWLLTSLVTALTPRTSYEAVESASTEVVDDDQVVASEPNDTEVVVNNRR